MPITPETIRRHLAELPQRRSPDAALELFDALGYQYAAELPVPIRKWPAGIRRLVSRNADPPIYLAQHRDFHVIYTHLTTGPLSRTAERPIVEHTLRKLHPYALFVFANRDLTLWDFVNVKYVAEDGARRRTIRRIHVGPSERLHTAAQRMALLAVPSLETSALELQSLHDQAFDVEEVTKQFYRDYVAVFDKLCADIARRNPDRKVEAETEAQMLLNQLLFLYFIQKKGWLNGQLDYLYRHCQAYYRADPDDTDFYSDFLFPLFVALSNEGMAPPALGDVPFLNGGLFEVPADSPLTDQLTVGNAVFRSVLDDLLERYNFTVREDTPLDVEVAIDPEMLGQIFENLVLGLERGEDRRKATGSYYTLRVIVHFMCRQALKEYLAAESGLDSARLEVLMDVSPAEQLTPEEVAELAEMITEPEARLLRGLVECTRVLDPAVGSGAFLVGMLYEMVALTKLLDVRLRGQKQVQRRNYDYNLKRNFIERNLYGVDIQPEAVRICELRLWLSLMVDYERWASEAVPTLPNLSYRVRVGDSLIERLFGEPVQLDELADDAVARQLIDRIQTEKQAYFKEPNLWEKQRRELRILGLLCELAAKLVGAKRAQVLQKMSAQVPLMGDAFMSREQRKLKEAFDAELARYEGLMEQVKGVYDEVRAMETGEVPAVARKVDDLRKQLGLSFIWRLDFAEVFADKRGFDIVIANPPYLGEKGHKDIFRPIAQSPWGRQYYQRKMDVLYFFLHLALDLSKDRSCVCFITTNYYVTADGAETLRKDFAQRSTVLGLYNFGELRLFSSATGQHNMITLLQRGKSDRPAFTFNTKRQGFVDESQLQLVLSGTDPETEYLRIPQDELFVGAEHFMQIASSDISVFDFKKVDDLSVPLSYFAERIFMGVQTGCDVVTKSLIRAAIEKGLLSPTQAQHYRIGSGIYVLTRDELQAVRLTDVEKRDCVKPFYKNSEIMRYLTPKSLSRYLLYVDSQTDIDQYPNIKAHLLKNRPLMAAREQAATEDHNWFWIRGSKRKSYFYRLDTIVVPYRAKSSRFSLCNQDIFGAGDVYYIALKRNLSTKALLGYLNSSLVWYHLYKRGKRKGETIEYYKRPLQDIPVHRSLFEQPNVTALEQMVDAILTIKRSSPQSDTSDLEREIDQYIYQMFNLSAKQTSVIEEECGYAHHD